MTYPHPVPPPDPQQPPPPPGWQPGPPPGGWAPVSGQPGWGPPPAGPTPGWGPGGPPPGLPEPPPPIGFSLSVAWQAFQDHRRPLLVAGGAILLVILVLTGLFIPLYVELILSASRGDSSPQFSVGSVVAAAATIPVSLIISPLLSSNLLRICLGILDGQRPATFEIFRFHRVGATLGASFLVLLGTSVGMLLLYVPGLLFAIGASYTMYFVHGRNLGPVAAIKASFGLMRQQLGPALAASLLGGLISSVGAYAALIGIVVSGPVGYLFLAHQFRGLTTRRLA